MFVHRTISNLSNIGQHTVCYPTSRDGPRHGFVAETDVRPLDVTSAHCWAGWLESALAHSQLQAQSGERTFTCCPFYLSMPAGIRLSRRVRLHLFFRVYVSSTESHTVDVFGAVSVSASLSGHAWPEYFAFKPDTYFHVCSYEELTMANVTRAGKKLARRLRPLVHGLSSI